MKRLYNITLILLLLLFASAGVSAQIRGVITDSLTHEPLMYITVQYEGKGVGGISNADGEYQVETRKGWNELTFSAIGYITKKVKFAPGTKVLNVALAPADVMLSEVVVKPKKEKYSRKNNPAVEFMKKVIEHKKSPEARGERLLPVPEVRKDEDVHQRRHAGENGERHLQEILFLQGPGGSVAQDQQDDSAHLHQGDGFQNHLPQKPQEREDHHRGNELQRHRGVLQHGRYVRYYPY